MKRRSLPVGILVIALLVALGSLGVVYGAVWQQDLSTTATVNTATFSVYWDVATDAAPVGVGSGVVGCTLSGDDTANLALTINNAYPNRGCAFTASVVNASSIPVKLSVPPTFSGDSWLLGSSSLYLHEELNANGGTTGPHAYTVMVTEDLEPQASSVSGTGTFSLVATQN